jgi:hypothetical protein
VATALPRVVAMQGISGINFEFYRLNHQFPDNFKF